MRAPVELDPDVNDIAPIGDDITVYDERHFVTYLRLLDAKVEGADWKEAASIVLHRDPATEEIRTYRCWQSHLERAQWLSRELSEGFGTGGSQQGMKIGRVFIAEGLEDRGEN